MSDCQFPHQCGFPNCFCVGQIDRTKRNQRNAIVITIAGTFIGFIVGMAV